MSLLHFIALTADDMADDNPRNGSERAQKSRRNYREERRCDLVDKVGHNGKLKTHVDRELMWRHQYDRYFSTSPIFDFNCDTDWPLSENETVTGKREIHDDDLVLVIVHRFRFASKFAASKDFSTIRALRFGVFGGKRKEIKTFVNRMLESNLRRHDTYFVIGTLKQVWYMMRGDSVNMMDRATQVQHELFDADADKAETYRRAAIEAAKRAEAIRRDQDPDGPERQPLTLTQRKKRSDEATGVKRGPYKPETNPRKERSDKGTIKGPRKRKGRRKIVKT